MTAAHSVQLLLVEDNPADVRLTLEVLGEVAPGVSVDVVRDGVEAMSFLRRRAPHERAPRPDLILLDLNLPRRDGREVLAQLKTDPALSEIPAVILTTSAAAEDVRRCYELQANAFLTKPVDLARFRELVERVVAFWLGAPVSPRGG